MKIDFTATPYLIVNPYFYISIAVIILLLGRFVFKIKYINCFIIIEKHLDNFKGKNKKLLVVPLITYFVIPLILAIATVNINLVNQTITERITLIFSILTGMLFTLLVLIIDMKSKVELRNKEQGSRITVIKGLIKQTYYTIMFELILAISILIMSFITLFTQNIDLLTSLTLYYLTYLFFFNLFMVMKRIFKIVEDDFNS